MKNNKFRITIDILLIIIGVVFFIGGIKDLINYNKANTPTDAQKFHKSYNQVLVADSKYKYINYDDIDNAIESNQFIFIAKTTDMWSQIIAKPLNDIAIKQNKKIFYLELDKFDESDKKYSEIVDKINIDNFDLPLIVVTHDKQKKCITKDEWYDKEYAGIPSEYFNQENLEKLSELLR